jgi:hypothetical protein
MRAAGGCMLFYWRGFKSISTSGNVKPNMWLGAGTEKG